MDEIYKGEDYLSKNIYGKFLYYRTQKDGIDIDSCKMLMPIYFKLLDNILEKEDIVCERKSGSIGYELKNKKFSNLYFRGDTAINCMSIIQQIVNIGIGQRICKTTIDEEIIKFLREDGWEEIFKLLEVHIRLCYGLGNFYPIPHSYKSFCVNPGKDRLIKHGFLNQFDDDMSLFLQAIRCCYLRISLCNTSVQNFMKIMEKSYAKYLELYGIGEKGWERYIKLNHFNAFVNNDLSVINFWNDNIIINCNNIDSKKEIVKSYLISINCALEQRQNEISDLIVLSDSELFEEIFGESFWYKSIY